ncbi:MAG TPA: glycoside hydrolase family 13 protein [Bacillota bacterium]|nr:glycoside hydrolase family 13 protein [Bacillota bacterium]
MRSNASPLILPERSTTSPAWLEDTVFYQIFPERFCNGDQQNDPKSTVAWGSRPENFNFFGGDLEGITQKLGYLERLGINALYLNPIFDAPSNHKYDTRDYLRIAPEFGDMRTYLRLVRKLHEKGIRVILDGVFNHTGDDFWAFKDLLLRQEKSPYKKWYHCRAVPVSQTPNPNYECWWGIGTLPKLNYSEPEVVKYILHAVAFWTMTGIDGWRLDVPNEVVIEFWHVFKKLVKAINPEAYIVGEIWEDATPWLGNRLFDAVMNYVWRDLVLGFFAHENMNAASFEAGLRALREKYSLEVTSSMFNLLGSHDTPRFLTMCGGRKDRMLMALLFQFTYPGVPVIYYGDEIGMTGDKDPDCRKTMIWDETRWDKEIYQTYRKLIHFRKEKEVLKRGDYLPVAVTPDGILGYWRSFSQERMLVVFNRTDMLQHICIPVEEQYQGAWKSIYPMDGPSVKVGDRWTLALPPRMGMIWEWQGRK